jgi:hypothetical protein
MTQKSTVLIYFKLEAWNHMVKVHFFGMDSNKWKLCWHRYEQLITFEERLYLSVQNLYKILNVLSTHLLSKKVKFVFSFIQMLSFPM